MTELDFIAERLLAIQAEQASIRAAMRAEMSEMRADLSDGQTVLTEMVMQLMKDMGFVRAVVDVGKHADLSLIEEAGKRLK